MTQPYVGEIRMFAGNFAPAGWMFCEGQLLSIAENETLFNLIGITYGGDGQNTFQLPDLRGRIPIHFGNGFTLAETGGVEQITLTSNQIPSHSHPLIVSQNSGNSSINGVSLAAGQEKPIFIDSNIDPLITTLQQSITSTGGSQPHNNFMPYLCVDYIISLYGIFPSPT